MAESIYEQKVVFKEELSTVDEIYTVYLKEEDVKEESIDIQGNDNCNIFI